MAKMRSARPDHLPPNLTRCVGREREIVEVTHRAWVVEWAPFFDAMLVPHNKLGVSSHTQIAVWAVEHGLCADRVDRQNA